MSVSDDNDSEQKNKLIPEGESGESQSKSTVYNFVVKAVDG